MHAGKHDTGQQHNVLQTSILCQYFTDRTSLHSIGVRTLHFEQEASPVRLPVGAQKEVEVDEPSHQLLAALVRPQLAAVHRHVPRRQPVAQRQRVEATARAGPLLDVEVEQRRTEHVTLERPHRAGAQLVGRVLQRVLRADHVAGGALDVPGRADVLDQAV